MTGRVLPTITTIRRDAADLPTLRVVVTAQDGPVVSAPLGLAPVVVGSGADADLVVADTEVSRRHCELSLTERGVTLRDLESKNGTWVADARVERVMLGPSTLVTVGTSRLRVEVAGPSTALAMSASARFGDALGGSVAMRAVFAMLERAAPTNETVLLVGASGTGKELLARAIHDASPRRGGAFVVLDCAGVAPSVVEAELFGWVKGAFTGAHASRGGLLEQSDGGTLFIDEIGEMPLELQPKLLRALEARQVRPIGSQDWRSFDARVVAATHRDLAAGLADKTFREDLYYRLSVVEVRVPPLRDRKEDIPLLVERFLAAQTPPRSSSALPPNAMSLLLAHDWPGNVRELRNTVARLMLFPDLGRDAIGPPSGAPTTRDAGAPMGAVVGLALREARDVVIEQFERAYVAAKLAEHAGNVARAAEAMGVSRQFAYKLVERYGLK